MNTILETYAYFKLCLCFAEDILTVVSLLITAIVFLFNFFYSLKLKRN